MTALRSSKKFYFIFTSKYIYFTKVNGKYFIYFAKVNSNYFIYFTKVNSK
jgi:hypothetical protein